MGRVLIRVVAVVAILVIGGFALVGVYNAGVTAGLAQAGTGVSPYIGVPYGPGYGFGFGFGGIFGFLGLLLFLFLLFGLLRAAFGGRRGPGTWGGQSWSSGRGWSSGSSRDRWERGVPPPVEEWHRRLHEERDRPSGTASEAPQQ